MARGTLRPDPNFFLVYIGTAAPDVWRRKDRQGDARFGLSLESSAFVAHHLCVIFINEIHCIVVSSSYDEITMTMQ